MGKKLKEYLHVFRIERTSPKQIVIRRETYDTIMDFDTAEECLKRYIEIQNEYKEAMTFEWTK